MYHNNKRYALTNCVILDGSEHMEPQTGKAVCIDGEKIAEITDAQHIPAGYETVDLGGRYVLPGLINMHVHLPASGKPKKKASDPKKLVKLITSCGLMNKIGVNLCESYAKTELLSGVTVTDEASLYRAADTLLAAGLQRVFISLGADGVLAADHERKIHLHNLPARMVNTTGCGDAFMAAVARAFLDGADLETAAKRGLAASAIAMESADTINPAMSLTAVAERIQ